MWSHNTTVLSCCVLGFPRHWHLWATALCANKEKYTYSIYILAYFNDNMHVLNGSQRLKLLFSRNMPATWTTMKNALAMRAIKYRLLLFTILRWVNVTTFVSPLLQCDRVKMWGASASRMRVYQRLQQQRLNCALTALTGNHVILSVLSAHFQQSSLDVYIPSHPSPVVCQSVIARSRIVMWISRSPVRSL